MHRYIVPALLVTLAGILPADVLRFRDGRTIEGRLISATSRQITFLEQGRTTSRAYQVTAVDGITFGNNGTVETSRQSNAATRDGAYSSGTSVRPDNNRSTRTGTYSIPAGSVIRLRMIDAVNSDETNVGDSYKASLESPIVVDNRTLAPKGADATVRIARVSQGGVVSGNEEVVLLLNDLVINGRKHRVDSEDASVAGESRTKENATVVGGGAVLGAIIGAIAGGGKGAAIGAATGAGAGVAVQAVRGQKIQIPSETVLEFRLAQPLYID